MRVREKKNRGGPGIPGHADKEAIHSRRKKRGKYIFLRAEGKMERGEHQYKGFPPHMKNGKLPGQKGWGGREKGSRSWSWERRTKKAGRIIITRKPRM